MSHSMNIFEDFSCAISVGVVGHDMSQASLLGIPRAGTSIRQWGTVWERLELTERVEEAASLDEFVLL